MIWCNFSQYQMDRLDKIQNEAARITTGCSRFVSIVDLKKECGWETLADRKFKHRIILFYKMQNGQVPNYLCDLVPPTVGSTMSHNFRNSNNIHNIAFRTSLYGNFPAICDSRMERTVT